MQKVAHIITQIIAVIIYVFILNPTQAQTYQTVQSGNWSSPSTWENGNVPTNTDNTSIIIHENHTVTPDQTEKIELGRNTNFLINGNFSKSITWKNLEIIIDQESTFTVNGSFSAGANTIFRMGKNAELNVNGSFEISKWGNNEFILNDDAVLTIGENGTMHLRDKVTAEIGKNSTILIIGDLMISLENNFVFEIKNDAEINVQGNFLIQRGTYMKIGEKLNMNITGIYQQENWGTLTISNNSNINLEGAFIINNDITVTIDNNFVTDISGEMILNNDSDIEIGNNSVWTVSGELNKSKWGNLKINNNANFEVTGTFSIEQGKVIINDNANFELNGNILIDNEGDLIINNNANFDIAGNKSLIIGNSGTFEANDDLHLNNEGNIINENNFRTGKRAQILITETGDFVSNKNFEADDQLYFVVDGELDMGGYNFSIAKNSEFILNGYTRIENDWLFKSEDKNNIIHVCEENINDINYLPENVTKLDCGVLPVEMLSFEVNTDQNNNVILNWSTATETNSDYFQVERSTNGIDWIVIGSETAAGNSNEIIEYSFVDYNADNGISYYRLKQVDFDGAFEYYGPMAVEKTEMIDFQIVNINKSGNMITVHAQFKANSSILITDAMGNILFNESLTNDTNQIQFIIKNEIPVIVVRYVPSTNKQVFAEKIFVN